MGIAEVGGKCLRGFAVHLYDLLCQVLAGKKSGKSTNEATLEREGNLKRTSKGAAMVVDSLTLNILQVIFHRYLLVRLVKSMVIVQDLMSGNKRESVVVSNPFGRVQSFAINEENNSAGEAGSDLEKGRLHGSDVLKHGICQSILDSEVDLQASVPQWLIDATNLQQQKIQSMQSARLPKTLMNTGCNEVEQSSSVVKSRPRVFCFSTNGILSGELVLSDIGRLGVLCTCHNFHMFVAKFSEHVGSFSGNPRTTVRMESGETIIAWQKAFFFQFGVKVLDDDKGWDWNDVNASEVGIVKYKTLLLHKMWIGEPNKVFHSIFLVSQEVGRKGKKGGHPNSRVEEHDAPEGLRNRAMGEANKGYPQIMEYGAHSSA
eukprot:Gb_12299 [translate_table: standard]